MLLHKLKIGAQELQTNLLLAPIAGYCDLSFRLLARKLGGVGLASTDLLCPEGVLRENKRSMELAATCPEDSPLSMQIYGSDPNLLCEAAMWAEDRGAHVIDINMGCPVDKITKRDGGSKLLCNPDRTLGLVEKIKSCLIRTPLTAKLRLGWDDSALVAPYLAKRLEEAGVAMITIHGRTTEMRFGGKVRLEGISQVVAAVKNIPVIGNGDIQSPQDAALMIKTTGCAGVMIGRAALSKPWIFRDTAAFLAGQEIPAEPTIAEKCAMIRLHYYSLVETRSERVAILTFRKRISWYAKTMAPCRILRDKMRLINSTAEFEAVLEEFSAWRLDYEDRLKKGLVSPLPQEDTEVCLEN